MTTSHQYGSANTYAVELIVTDSSGATASTSQNVTVQTATTGSTVGVTSVTYAVSGRRTHNRDLNITVSLQDDTGTPVSGASVAIQLFLNGSSYATGSGTTGSTGTFSFTARNAPSGTYSTTVTAVSASGLTWDGSTPSNSYMKK